MTPEAGQGPDTLDPWVEVLAEAIRHNVREISRFTGGRRLLAVVKNNANGIGLRQVGPILDAMDEVHGLAVVRVDEALALRESGVVKPVLTMAPARDAEAVALVRAGIRLSPFHDDSRAQLERLAAATGAPVPVHLLVDTGMHREGMPHERALPWIADLAASPAVRIEGLYTQFSGAERDGMDWDREHLDRLFGLATAARGRGIDVGLVHGAPSYQITRLPVSHALDLVRPGGAIYGLDAYRHAPDGRFIMDLRPVFRLRARVVRLERIAGGEGVSFRHRYVATRPTWVALLPVGHTDGYPRDAAGRCTVLVGARTYPVIGVVSSNHAIIEIGEERHVELGDVATLIGPEHPEITPIAVARRVDLDRDYWIMTRLNALLRRLVVEDPVTGAH